MKKYQFLVFLVFFLAFSPLKAQENANSQYLYAKEHRKPATGGRKTAKIQYNSAKNEGNSPDATKTAEVPQEFAKNQENAQENREEILKNVENVENTEENLQKFEDFSENLQKTEDLPENQENFEEIPAISAENPEETEKTEEIPESSRISLENSEISAEDPPIPSQTSEKPTETRENLEKVAENVANSQKTFENLAETQENYQFSHEILPIFFIEWYLNPVKRVFLRIEEFFAFCSPKYQQCKENPLCFSAVSLALVLIFIAKLTRFFGKLLRNSEKPQDQVYKELPAFDFKEIQQTLQKLQEKLDFLEKNLEKPQENLEIAATLQKQEEKLKELLENSNKWHASTQKFHKTLLSSQKDLIDDVVLLKSLIKNPKSLAKSEILTSKPQENEFSEKNAQNSKVNAEETLNSKVFPAKEPNSLKKPQIPSISAKDQPEEKKEEASSVFSQENSVISKENVNKIPHNGLETAGNSSENANIKENVSIPRPFIAAPNRPPAKRPGNQPFRPGNPFTQAKKDENSLKTSEISLKTSEVSLQPTSHSKEV